MRHTTLVACTLLTLSCFAQQSINLPRDNGKTVSFCESLDLGKGAKAFYDTACAQLPECSGIKVITINGNETSAFIHFTEMQQGIYGKMTIVRSGKYVNYCIQDFKVNGRLLDEWLETANPIVAEQVKGRIFATSVLIVASIKKNSAVLTQR